MVNTIATVRLGFARVDQRTDYLRRCSDSGVAPGLIGAIADAVVRYAPVTTIVNDLNWKLHDGEFGAEYPATAVAEAIEQGGLR